MIYRFTAIAVFALWSLLSPVNASTTSTPAPTRTSTALININTADAATLAREMKGIGDSKARAIVEHRQKNGAFRSVDELALVKGIGAKTLENNRARLTVGAGATAPKTAATKPPLGTPSSQRPTAANQGKPSAGGR
jgi:competence protein ComEA